MVMKGFLQAVKVIRGLMSFGLKEVIKSIEMIELYVILTNRTTPLLALLILIFRLFYNQWG